MAHINTLDHLQELLGTEGGQGKETELVELAEQLDTLRELGISSGRGYRIESPFTEIRQDQHNELEVATAINPF